MSKKSQKLKMRLGKKLKQNRRVPALAMLRTHRSVQYNRFQRSWRHRKMRLSKEV
ncbi:MAG: 50S ribosomal protein L39e [Candidatus Micrarchaeota archaeon]|nr:50S ribosomal protein L39e [Candidatus Micrarchaeota archaeon]MDE1823896.1 50S ribosomal protein L39e [Candidatus Micrarchaeota archaeon]MDE1849310.1 50S ribosomal protein L39e [Candidatus Micrarchaeota archaeon]